MGHLFSEPIYSQKIKEILFQDSPFYRKFYDSWMTTRYFSSKSHYADKFLVQTSVTDVLKSITDPVGNLESQSPSEIALLGFLLVSLKIDPLINHQILKDFPKLADFADRASEQLVLIPYRGTNRLISSVEEATNSRASPIPNPSSDQAQNHLTNVVIYLSIVAAVAFAVKAIIKGNKN
jgi:hypothetical protein